MIFIKNKFKSELVSVVKREELDKNFDFVEIKLNYKELEKMLNEETRKVYKNVDSDELALYIEKQIYDYLHFVFDYSMGC